MKQSWLKCETGIVHAKKVTVIVLQYQTCMVI